MLWCRVYLLGGADAKAPHDIVPVYTPSFVERSGNQKQLMMWNVTLPHGFFSAAAADLEGMHKHGVVPLTAASQLACAWLSVHCPLAFKLSIHNMHSLHLLHVSTCRSEHSSSFDYCIPAIFRMAQL